MDNYFTKLLELSCEAVASLRYSQTRRLSGAESATGEEEYGNKGRCRAQIANLHKSTRTITIPDRRGFLRFLVS